MKRKSMKERMEEISEEDEEPEEDLDEEEVQEEPEKKKVKEDGRYVVRSVPTQTTPMVVDVNEEEVLQPEAVMARLLSNQARVLKLLEKVLKNLEG